MNPKIADSNSVQGGAPLARSVYAFRVTSFAAGAKIGSDNDPSAHRTLQGGFFYMDDQPFDVYSSGGQVVIEYVTKPGQRNIFDGSGNTGPADGATKVIGTANSGALKVGELGGLGGAASPLVLDGGGNLFARMGGSNGFTGDLALYNLLLGKSGYAGSSAKPLLVQPHASGDPTEKGYTLYSNGAIVDSAGIGNCIGFIMAGLVLHTYVRRVRVVGLGNATAQTAMRLNLQRGTGKGNGVSYGGVWGRRHDGGAIYSGDFYKNGSPGAAGGGVFGNATFLIPTPAASPSGTLAQPWVWDFSDDPIRLPAGTQAAGGTAGALAIFTDVVAPAGMTGFLLELDVFERSY